jgi:hypothetical protein
MRLRRIVGAATLAVALIAPAAAGASYQSTVKSTAGLAAYWPLDDPAGTTITDTVGAVAGSLSGQAALGQTGALSDDTGSALALVGNGAATFANVLDLPGDLSIEAWFAASSVTGGTRYLVSKGTTTTGYGLLLTSTGAVQMIIGRTTGNTTLTGPVLATGWHHVVATLSGLAMKLYVDGKQVNSGTLLAPRAASVTPLVFGRYASSASAYFSGLLDEIALYNAALSPDTIAAHFAAGADTTLPKTTLTASPPALTNKTDAVFTFTGSKTGLLFQCKLDGGNYTTCPAAGYTGLAEGSHTLLIRATDRYGLLEATPVSFTWVIDLRPPDTLLLAAGGQAAFVSETGAHFECSVAGGDFQACVAPVALTGAAFAVRAVDPAGNADLTPATVAQGSEVLGLPASGFGGAKTPFAINGGRSTKNFDCKLDTADWATCPDDLVFAGLTYGAHTLAIRDPRLTGIDGFPTLTWNVPLPLPKLIGAHFPAIVGLGNRSAQRTTKASRIPRLLFQSNIAAVGTVELRRGKALVKTWTTPIVQGTNAITLPRAVWRALNGGRYVISVTGRNASGAGAPLRARFDTIRRGRV